ncbi:hypothetical protein [Endozoicomonas arenosclerae]|uniref:hypothetical protein n=1 Tax=Endozoicomonas arenosclerae TaxID=1633495 RepID=UPI000782A522|nr:hypothetical protein [Endozoicomonas arenosclerae]
MKQSRLLFDERMVPSDELAGETEGQWIDSKLLLVSNRIDLVPKLLYIKSLEQEREAGYPEYLYKEHLACFSLGKFIEPGNPEKDSFLKYKNTFNKLFESIKHDGFDSTVSLIPVSKKGNCLIDGAHRSSCAIYLNKNIPIVQFDTKPKKFDIQYFISRGMLSQDADYILKSYIEINDSMNFYAICIWPNSREYLNSIETEINENFNILFKKNIILTDNGAHNFLSQIYSKGHWVGNYKNDYQGIIEKKSECFGSCHESLTVFFIETSKELDDIVKFKEDIRDKFGKKKHLLHITDDKEECLQVCELLLNENSINHLNNSFPTHSKNFQMNFEKFRKELEDKEIDRESICIINGSVLSVFGIRDTDDIDYVCSNTLHPILGGYDLANNLCNKVGIDINELVYNPNQHFYYMGIKFASLDVFLKIKNFRREPKDLDDIKLVKCFESSDKNVKSYLFSKKVMIKRNCKRFFMLQKNRAVKLTKTLGVYGFLKSLIGGK